eukprot:gene8876-biopygen8541
MCRVPAAVCADVRRRVAPCGALRRVLAAVCAAVRRRATPCAPYLLPPVIK